MSETATRAAPTTDGLHWLSVCLIILAALKACGALTDLPAIFVDYGHSEPKLVVAQTITTGRLIVAPWLALGALYLAAKDRLAGAIMLLGALILAQWLGEVPDIFIHGLDLSLTFGAITVLISLFVYPLLATAAIFLAIRRRMLTIAAGLVAIPTLVSGILVIGFAVFVTIHGF